MDVILSMALISAVIIIGFLGNITFQKTSIPNVVWLLLFGILLGPILGIVNTAMFAAASEFFAAIALIIILFDGGIYMDVYRLFKDSPRGSVLAITNFTFTVIATTTITTVLTLIGVLQFDLMTGMLLGAIVGGTSSPIVIPIITKLKNMGQHTKNILAIESAVTDVLCIVVAIALMQAIKLGNADPIATGQALASAFSIGMVAGSIAGLFWIPIMKKFQQTEFAYVVTLAVLFLLYAGVEMLTGSGGIACLMFGIILANGKKIFGMIKYENLAFELTGQTKQFHSTLAFLVRTFFFVYLGLVVTASNIMFIALGVVLTIAFLLIRPLSVHLTTLKSTTFKPIDKQVMNIMIPRGLAAAVLANLAIAKGIPNAEGFMDIIFTVILGTVLICTIGIAWVRKKYPEELEQPKEEHHHTTKVIKNE